MLNKLLKPYLVIPAIFGFTKFGLHFALARRYGIHGDELYFIECARHLSLGYVDHAPLVPWLTALTQLIGDDLFILRFLPALAGGVTIFIALLIVHRMKGQIFAQVLTGLALMLAPAYLRMFGLMHLPAFELLFWTVNAFILIKIQQENRPHLWWMIGLVTGLGLLTKHTMFVWGAGFIIALLVDSNFRKHLRSPHLWGAGILSLALFSPNLYWQATHGWPTLEFISGMSSRLAKEVPTPLFLLSQLIYIGPMNVILWIAGVFTLMFGVQKQYRVLAILFLVPLAIYTITHGKPYYLASTYPPLIAAGSVYWEKWISAKFHKNRKIFSGQTVRIAYLMLFVSINLITAIPGLPIISLPLMNRYILALLYPVIKDPVILTSDFHYQYGWRDQAATVAKTYRNLSVAEQRETVILTGNYAEAAAFNIFEVSKGDLPRAVSGHMTYYFWDQPNEKAQTFLVYGFPEQFLRTKFKNIKIISMIDHPLAAPSERNRPIYICKEPIGVDRSISFDDFKRFGFLPYGQN